jgi:hypothetical protein
MADPVFDEQILGKLGFTSRTEIATWAVLSRPR